MFASLYFHIVFLIWLIAENEGQRPKASSFTPINYASSKAAIPGKILPSNNSKLAPPPVEMWLI